ncbi:MAG TPA: hypothetical protein VIX20_01245, partial [Ktedonobacteraceae bacterium]
MSLEPKSAMEEVNTVLPRKPRFTLTVLHLPRNVYLLLFFTLRKGFKLLLKYPGVSICACTHPVPAVYSTHYVTAYGVTYSKQLTHPEYHVQERKAARKKLLDEIFRRRGERYK